MDAKSIPVAMDIVFQFRFTSSHGLDTKLFFEIGRDGIITNMIDVMAR
jgi:hypothetical protein